MVDDSDEQWSIFLSYADEDEEFANQLRAIIHTDLKVARWHEVSSVHSAAIQDVRQHRFVVVFLSPSFTGHQKLLAELEGIEAQRLLGSLQLIVVSYGVGLQEAKKIIPSFPSIYPADTNQGTREAANLAAAAVLQQILASSGLAHPHKRRLLKTLIRLKFAAREIDFQQSLDLDRFRAIEPLAKNRIDSEGESIVSSIREEFLETLDDLGLQVEVNKLEVLTDFGNRLKELAKELRKKDIDPVELESLAQMSRKAFERVAERLAELTERMPDTATPNTATMLPNIAVSTPLDDIHFTLTTSARLLPGTTFELRFWVHLENQRQTVLERARFATGAVDPWDLLYKSEGPFQIERGAKLTVRLSIEGLDIAPDHKVIVWLGEIGCATFVVISPSHEGVRCYAGIASVRVNGMQITRFHFSLTVGREIPAAIVSEPPIFHKSAFASYATEDREAVIARVQGMEVALKGLHVFIDLRDLRSGDYWEQKLVTAISECDVFYLFWCRHSQTSPWVRREWMYALKMRGLEYIEPIPLESPQFAPPPPELSTRQFNDPLLSLLSPTGAHV